MKLDDRQLHKFFGFNTQGDLGPYTFYTDKRGQLVFFLKAPPKTPGSPFQLVCRDNMRLAAKFWNALPITKRLAWEAATKRLSLKLTGYNLFTFWFIKGDDNVIRTIEHQSNTALITQT